jgi:hypothetical protein
MNAKIVALLVQEMVICDEYMDIALENRESDISGLLFMLADDTDRKIEMLVNKLKENDYKFTDDIKEAYNEHVKNKHVKTHLFHTPVTGLMD